MKITTTRHADDAPIDEFEYDSPGDTPLIDPFGRDSMFGIRDYDWFDYPDFYEETEESEESKETEEVGEVGEPEKDIIFQELYNDLLIHGPVPELELAMDLIINDKLVK